MSRPKILVTNDDGIYAAGIKALWEAMSEIGDVTVVAPNLERSAVGHAITFSDPLRVEEITRVGSFRGFAVNGTPSDCVKIGVQALMQNHPVILVSGINHGSNTGTSIIYSGTVSAATEGTMLNIPSVAVSLNKVGEADFSTAKKVTKKVVKQVLYRGLPQKTLLNVNIPLLPENEIKGYRITEQGNVFYQDNFERRADPRGKVYYWMTGKMIDPDNGLENDHKALAAGYVSITPIHYRLTNHDFISNLSDWDF